MSTATTDAPSTDPMASAIAVFTREGYDATTVDALAEAMQLSRSTFFRRFGSKDDVVFADHEVLLQRVAAFLDSSTLPPLQAASAAARLVFEHHVSRRDVSVARFGLLHEVPALRDRELITSHRYERLFADYLRTTLPAVERSDSDRREFVSIAFSAALVAVHNAVLREWLFDPSHDFEASLDARLRSLVRAFSPPRDKRAEGTVVVTIFDPDADREVVLDSIRAALP
jgi:AcrR family transcriptional regulator